jgi:hypothetical protein
MGKRAKMHPLWIQIRELFFQYFPGDKIRNVTYRQPDPILCNPLPLLQQAAGCLARAIVYQNGKPASPADVVEYIKKFGENLKEEIFHKATLHAEELYITQGISLGGINNVKPETPKINEIVVDVDWFSQDTQNATTGEEIGVTAPTVYSKPPVPDVTIPTELDMTGWDDDPDVVAARIPTVYEEPEIDLDDW